MLLLLKSLLFTLAIPGTVAIYVPLLIVRGLSPDSGGVTNTLRAAGFRHGAKFEYDVFHKKAENDPELRKLYMREPEGERRTRFTSENSDGSTSGTRSYFATTFARRKRFRAEYELLKRRAAQLFPDSIDGYLFLKDPVEHIIYEAASLWAEKVRWSPDEDYL